MHPSPDDQSVSVVIPCYNGMPYLVQSLDSAVAQTHRPCEVLVVDDGSRDDSADTVNRYIAEHPEAGVRLIRQPNAGEPAARNTGIRAATGRWVAQLDTDDWWEPRKLELQLRAADDPALGGGPECVMVHTAVIGHLPDGSINHPGDRPTNPRTGWATAALLQPGSIGHPSIMVRRDALETIGGYDPTYKQACDIDLYFRLSVVGTFAFVPVPLLHYRYHAGQMSASQVRQIAFHHRAVRSFFAAHPDLEARIGPVVIETHLARHVAIKLESLYWRRRLDDFRQLLDYAREQKLDSDDIRAWRRRARWPDWVIHFKDRLAGGRRQSAAPAPQP